MERTEVAVRLGTTLNIGDFQSVRIDIEVKDHIREVDGGSTAKAIDRVFDMVDAKVTEKAESFKK